MAANHSLELRKAIVKKLSANAALTALVPAASIYGEMPAATPSFPFIRYGLPVVDGPLESAGWDGAEHAVTLHAFSQPKNGAGDEVMKIAAAVQKALADDTLALDALGLVSVDWLRTETVRDTDNLKAYHAIISFTVGVVSLET